MKQVFLRTKDGLFGVSVCQPKSLPAGRVCSSMSNSKDGLKVKMGFVGFFGYLFTSLSIVTKKVKVGKVQITEVLAVGTVQGLTTSVCCCAGGGDAVS